MSLIVINFGDYRRISQNVLKAIAFDFRSFGDERKALEKIKILCKNLFSVFCLVNIVTFYALTCLSMWQKSRDDFKMMFYLLCTLLSVLVALTRILHSFWRRGDLAKISAQSTRIYTRQQCDYYNLHADIRTFKRIMRYYFSSLVVTVVVFFLEPILTLVFTGRRTFGNLSPFDERATGVFVYPLALAWTGWQFTTMCITMLGIELILYSALMITILEFKRLRRDCADLRTFQGLRTADKVRKLIERHNELFDGVAKLEDAFSFQLFCTFYSTAFNMCFTAFQASTSSEAAELIGMAYFSMSTCFGMFIQSYFGDLLKTVSIDIINGIYESGWEEMREITIAKELPFIIRRARKPAKLTVMNIADVSLYQFANVVSFSYSFFTVCRRIYFK